MIPHPKLFSVPRTPPQPRRFSHSHLRCIIPEPGAIREETMLRRLSSSVTIGGWLVMILMLNPSTTFAQDFVETC